MHYIVIRKLKSFPTRMGKQYPCKKKCHLLFTEREKSKMGNKE